MKDVNQVFRAATAIVFLSLLFSCGGKASYTVNWFLRIDKLSDNEGYHLMAGDEEVLPALEAAIWNGDSLVVRRGTDCYFLDMSRAVDYHSEGDLEPIDCALFADYVKVGGHVWPP